MLTKEKIAEIAGEDLPTMYSGDIDFGFAIEAAVFAELREGGVELPDPYEREFTTGEMIKHFSEWQMLDYGDRRAAAVAPQWMPIESAPKDGTVILGLRGNKVADAYVVQRDDCEMWKFGSITAAIDCYPEAKPTHWMPLPPSPKEQP